MSLVLGENGIIEKTKYAREEYEKEGKKEKDILLDYEDIINRETGKETKRTVSFQEAKSDERLTSTDNIYTYDVEENLIFVPAGFKITEEETLVRNGIVIEDSEKNQFVLIPVNGKHITLARKQFDETGVIASYTYQENKNQKIENIINVDHQFYGEGSDLAKQYLNTDYNIEEFIKSVESNKGFYISRYEIGDADATEARTSETVDTNKAVSKSNQFVYNYIPFNQAMELANNMYTSEKFVSTLCNSYAYDTMLEFLIKNSGKTDYATGAYGNMKISEDETAVLYKTGMFGDVACNIYDVSGNVREMTTELHLNENVYNEKRNTVRGGTFGYLPTKFSAGSRAYMSAESEKIGFRVIIY